MSSEPNAERFGSIPFELLSLDLDLIAIMADMKLFFADREKIRAKPPKRGQDAPWRDNHGDPKRTTFRLRGLTEKP